MLIFLIKIDSLTQSMWAYLYSLQHNNDGFTLSLLDIVLKLNTKKHKLIAGELLFKSIKYGGNDNIIDVVLQNHPDDAKKLYIQRFIDFDTLSSGFTSRSLNNIKMHRGGFTKEDLDVLSTSFMSNCRYDLLSALY